MKPEKKIVQLVLYFFTFCFSSFAQKNVVTQHNDDERTGRNDAEYILNQSNVRPGSFGKLFTRPLDAFVYAQPLVVSNIFIPGKGMRNVVYVATVNNTVYAFDADSASVTEPYWSVNVTPAFSKVVSPSNFERCAHGNDFLTTIGIVGTPVIDTATKTIYFVARSVDTVNNIYQQYLHAINIATGEERPVGPKLITASVNGTGIGNVGGVISFDPWRQNQRAGLLLLNNDVVICWGSHCDWQPYHGWLMSYDKKTLAQKIVYNISPNGEGGGIWMCGGGPSADADGNIYFTAGDGTAGTPENPSDPINRGLSVVKLTPSGSNVTVSDFFTPKDYFALDAENRDLTSQVMLVPNSNLTMASGKDGLVYVLDRNNMGGFHPDTNMIAQIYSYKVNKTVHASFAYYKGSQKGFAFFWPGGSELVAFPYNYTTQRFDFDSTVTSTSLGPSGIHGTAISVSSNGSIDSTAIVWTSHIESGQYPANLAKPGRLRAFAANNVQNEIWNSGIVPGDSLGRFGRYVSPTIANGKVYMGTHGNMLVVYGLTGGSVSTCGNINIALGKPAFASSVNGSNAASNATDGKINTRWNSLSGNPQSIYVDLGMGYNICKIVLKWKNKNAQNFNIQVSDDAITWHDITIVNSNTYSENNLLVSGTGRYVRMYGSKSKGNGYDLQELEVYGSQAIAGFATASTSFNSIGNK